MNLFSPAINAAVPAPPSACGPLRLVARPARRPWETRNRWRSVVRDQAGGAFGAAAVPRPAGSSFMPLRRTRHRLGLATWLECRAPNTSPPSSVGSGSCIATLPRGRAPVLVCSVALQDLTPARRPTHTKDPASRQAGPGGGDLWGAEEPSGGGGARSALRQHSHRTCLNEEPAGRVVSCAMRPCREHRRAVCAFSARPLHHEPAPGPACHDARQRQSQRNPSTAADKRPASSGRNPSGDGDASSRNAPTRSSYTQEIN